MSIIEEMSILGVRSFGPERRQHQQKIEFFTPLTLILGENGSGKTTIIECLKYMTTGEMPLGKGCSFIHDPGLAEKDEVIAEIVLRLRDVKKERVVATRSLSVKQGTTKQPLKYAAKGCIINDRDYRITDMNKLITSLIGVSKPILENVIFCHQEHSNWPLGDDKLLKDKFDEIFAATKYREADKRMNKLRTDLKVQSEAMVGEIGLLRKRRDEAAAQRDMLKTKKQERKVLLQESVEISKKLEPLEEEMQTIDSYKNADSNLVMLAGELKQMKKQLHEEQTNVVIMVESEENLQEKHIELTNEVRDNERNAQDLEYKYNKQSTR